MGRYLIVEPEERSLQLIQESLVGLDKDARFETFKDFKSLDNHFEKLTDTEKITFWNFDLYILEHSLCTHPEWVEKIPDLQSKNQKKAAILLTGYDNAFTALKYIRALEIYNFLFKPLDPLILKESLNIAINVAKKVSLIEIKSQSISAYVAFLKEIELQSISELGFVSLSEAEIKPGSTTKYFSPLFTYGKKRSAWAKCLISLPHPQKPGVFINKFHFYGADQTFLNNLRRYIQANKSNHTSSALWSFAPPKSLRPLKMAIISADSLENQNFAEDIKNHYKNLQVEIVKIDPETKTTSPPFEHDIVLNLSEIKFENISTFFNTTAVYLWITPPFADEDQLKEQSQNYHDIFCNPLDRPYFYKKLKIHNPDLDENNQSSIVNITSHEKIKAANKVKISDPSELYVNILYPRELPLNDFREIVFLSEDEGQTVELPAICHFVEKSKNNDPQAGATYFHQFVFFGMKDQLLKQIRLWLLQRYIAENQKE